MGLEHIETSQVHQLKTVFEAAESVDSEKLLSLKDSKWTCDMFGMTTRLQVEKNVKLYHFTQDSDESGALKNRGAQLVKVYKSSKELKGANGSIHDQIRIAKDGKLVSRLELLGPKSQTPRLLAISVCKRVQI